MLGLVVVVVLGSTVPTALAVPATVAGGAPFPDRDLIVRDRDRRLRLAVLWEKRQAVTALRDANEIDDIVLREVQAAMDVEEVRLLGPVTPD